MGWLESVPHPETVAGWTLLLATFSLLGLFGLWQQLRDARRRFRAEVQPYLRIDLAPAGIEGTWTPRREPDTDLSYESFNPGETAPPSDLDRWPGDLPIYLWVENTQRAAGGVADTVRILMEFRFPDNVDPAVEWLVQRPVVFAYLEAGHLNRYEVAKVAPDIPWMTGSVIGIGYRDMFGQWSSWAHGSAGFTWNSSGIEHIRRVSRARSGLLGQFDRVILRIRTRLRGGDQ